MPQKDDEATQLNHGEEIGLLVFPADDKAAEVMEPGKEALDPPAAAVTAQFTAALAFAGKELPEAASA